MTPVESPLVGSVRPPGSKSISNRALVVAALADGTSRLAGLLDSRDTEVMVDSLRRLGIPVQHDRQSSIADVEGGSGQIPASSADLWLENSGTSLRFLSAVCALGQGSFRLDGNDRMRERPIADLVDALRQLGVAVTCETDGRCPPVVLKSEGIPGGTTEVSGETSSQYLSALLMIAPGCDGPVTINIRGRLVSSPYIDMTLGVMKAFGVTVDRDGPGAFHIKPRPYRAREYAIEPDASAASYFLAAAAITEGTVTIEGLGRDSMQGDVKFADVLEQMGCRVTWDTAAVTVQGGPLRGVDVDMNEISDTAQTLAAVAVFADGRTRIRNISHVRHKETDRIAAVVTELKRLGIAAEEHEDGLTISPGTPTPAVVQTYDDHRMAMSFALIGLRVPGIEIADPDCTAKTYPGFFADLDRLCGRRP